MFAECSLIMFAMQAIVFSPWFKPDTTRWLITPALAVLAAALFLVPRASDFTLMLVVIGGVAVLGFLLSLRLPHLLVGPNSRLPPVSA